MMRLIAVLALCLSLSAGAVDLNTTPLGQFAATLAPGQVAKFNTAGYLSLPWLNDSFYYGDSATWNPVTQQFEWVASPVGGTPRYRYTYNVATDTWATEYMPWQTPGHGYDSNADKDGVHYFVRYSGPVMRREANGTWTDLPLPAKPWNPGTEQSLSYWPGKGLVWVSRDGQVAVGGEAGWTKVTGAAAWGPQHTWSTVVGDVVYLGANGFAYKLAFVNGAYVLTSIPMPTANGVLVPIGGNSAEHTTDGNHLLVANIGGYGWFEFDGTAWAPRADLNATGAIVNKFHYYVLEVPELHIIVTMGQRTITGPHEVWVIKTAAPQQACAGAFICDKFDGAPLAGVIYEASSKMTKPYVKDGMLRMEIVSNGGTDTGHYRVRFPPVSEGGFMTWSYGKRMDAEAIKHQGQKDWIVWGPATAASCATQQFVITHMYQQNVDRLYRSCGVGIDTVDSTGDHQWQNSEADCWYRDAKNGRVDKCITVKPDTWNDYVFELKVGTYGQPDSNLKGYIKTTDGWKKFADYAVMLPSDKPLEVMMLTSYMTDEVAFTHPLGFVDFRNFVLSFQPLDLASI